MMYFIEIKPYDRKKLLIYRAVKRIRLPLRGFGLCHIAIGSTDYGINALWHCDCRTGRVSAFAFHALRFGQASWLFALLGKATHSQKITVVHRAGHRAARRAWSLVWRAAVGLLDGRYGFFIGGSRWEFECRQRIKIVIYFSPTVRSLAPPTRSQPKRK